MPHRTRCPVACALDLIGDRWSLLIIRDLMFYGRHEYKDLLAAGENISSNTLSQRLARLTRAGLITSGPHPDSKRRKLYDLTLRGKQLAPSMVALIAWADQHLAPDIPKAQRVLLRQNPQAVIDHALHRKTPLA
ncbi:MAG: helix-turn-helix domain-containing protein [Pseudomonadota bacterium]